MDTMNRFFATIDHQGAILDCTEMVANSMDRIPGFADCLAGVRKWIGTPIDQRSADILRFIKLPPVKTLDEKQPLEAAIFGATVLQISTRILADHGSFATIGKRLQDGASVDAINKFMAENPSFLGDLVIDAALRADRNPKFLNVLIDSVRDFESLLNALPKSPGGDRLMARMKADPTDDSGTGFGGAEPRGNFAPMGCAIGSSSTKGETATCVAYMVITVVIVLCAIFC
jgi:hypothetical protein